MTPSVRWRNDQMERASLRPPSARVAERSGSVTLAEVQVTTTMMVARMRNGTSNCEACTLSSDTPEKMTIVTKNGAIVVPNELTAVTMFSRCAGRVPGRS